MAKPRSSIATIAAITDDEDDHDPGVGEQLLAGRPDDLAQLGDDLAEEQRDPGEQALAGRLAPRPPVAAVGRGAVGVASRVLPASRRPGDAVGRRSVRSCVCRPGRRAGGTRTPNRRFWRPVLYQLSYDPSGRAPIATRPTAGMPRRRGRPPGGPSLRDAPAPVRTAGAAAAQRRRPPGAGCAGWRHDEHAPEPPRASPAASAPSPSPPPWPSTPRPRRSRPPAGR